MRLLPTAEHDMLRDSVTEMLQRSRPRQRPEEPYFDAASWHELHAAGMLDLLVPESDGGSGLGLVDAALVAELCGRAVLAAPFADHVVAALTCPQARADAGILLLGGDFALPHLATAHAVVFGDAALKVTSVLTHARVVETLDTGMPLHVLDWSIPALAPLRRPHDDRSALGLLILLAAEALGAASAAFDKTCGFVTERAQFGQSLGSFQAVRHQLADIATELESARSLIWYAAAAWDEQAEGWPRTALLAKAHITETAVASIRRCVELHGAIGFAWECDLHWWLKRALTNWSRGGTPDTIRRTLARLHS